MFGLYLGLSRGRFSGNWFRRCVCGIAHRCFVSMRRTTDIAPSACDMVDLRTRSHFVFLLTFEYIWCKFHDSFQIPFDPHRPMIFWEVHHARKHLLCHNKRFDIFQHIGSQFTMYGLAELVLCHAMAHQAPGYHQIHSTWRGGLRARDCWKGMPRPLDDQYQLYITFIWGFQSQGYRGIVQVITVHDLVLKPMVTCRSPMT